MLSYPQKVWITVWITYKHFIHIVDKWITFSILFFLYNKDGKVKKIKIELNLVNIKIYNNTFDLQKKMKYCIIDKGEVFMNLLSRLTTKAKFLILLGWTVLLLLVTILVVVLSGSFGSKVSYENYGTTPYDENLTLTLGLYESRQSSYHSNNKSNGLESANYNFFVFITKPKVDGYNVKIQYLNCQLILKTVEGTYKYETATSGRLDGTSTAITASTTTKQFTFSNALAKKISKESTSVTDLNQTPSEVYVNLYYTGSKEDKNTKEVEKFENNILYKVEVSDVNKLDYSKCVEKEVVDSGTTSVSLVNTSDDIVGLKITYTESTGTTSEREYYEDKISFVISLNSGNLGDAKLKSVKYEIIGTVDNEKYDRNNQFADKVYLGSFFGYVSGTSTTKTIENSIDVNYNLSELSIFIVIETTEKTIKLNDNLHQ